MIYANPGTSFAAVATGYPTGLTGTIGIRIRDTTEADVLARTTAGIVEGVDPDFPTVVTYTATLTAPNTVASYSVVWDDSFGNVASEDLTVSSSGTVSNATDYITSAALKATLGISVTTWDADVAASITAASRAIDKLCNRRFWQDADALQVRYFSPIRWDWLEIHDLVTLTTLASADDGTTTYANVWTLNSDFFLEPLNAQADADAWPYTSLRVHPSGAYTFNTFYPRSVQVTGMFGWPAVPGPIVDGTTLLAERLFKMKREAPLGVLAFQDVAVRVARADSNLMILVGPYVKHRAAVA